MPVALRLWVAKRKRKALTMRIGLSYRPAVSLSGKKLGILVSAGPEHPNFGHGTRLAEAALAQGVDVYLYCIDEAVSGLEDARLGGLFARGLKLYACGYSAQRRRIPPDPRATFAGLAALSDLIAATDRFVAFN